MKLTKMRWKRKAGFILVAVAVVIISSTLISFDSRDFKFIKNMDIFASLVKEISLYYVDDTDPEKLIESGINGMLESLDPYTTYISEEDVDEFKFMTTGQYGGIGALIRKAGEYTIISEPYEGYPANRAGLIAGDTLISIDGVSTKGKSIGDVSDLLKGAPNTKVSLKISRLGVDSTLNFVFEREQVKIKNVPYYGMINEEIGYIRLSNFTKDANKEVKQALNDLKEKNAKGIILDLRGNPGGLLNEAVDISNIWIPKGKEIVSTRGKSKEWYKSYVTQHPAIDTSISLAVLVNRGSASASEIVAGSLQDLDRAVILGQKTFGKGLVQTTRPLSYNSHLKVTTAKYYIPSGRCIQALDYTHRNEDGSVGHIPDSLISEFKTSNGRIVYDGGGIDPDIKIEQETPGNITVSLYTNNLIFDYATLYATKHDSIAAPQDFKISDEIFNDFVRFLSEKEYDYTTSSNDQLDELIRVAKYEGYYDIAKEEFKALKTKLTAHKEKDLKLFKDEISEILREEIVSRYYYQKGRILTSLDTDIEIQKAIELLNDKEVIFAILSGQKELNNSNVALKK